MTKECPAVFVCTETDSITNRDTHRSDIGGLNNSAPSPSLVAPAYSDAADLHNRSFTMCAEHFVTKGNAYGPKKGMQLVLTIPASPLPWEWPVSNVTAMPAKKKKTAAKASDMVIVLVVQDGRQPRCDAAQTPSLCFCTFVHLVRYAALGFYTGTKLLYQVCVMQLYNVAIYVAT